LERVRDACRRAGRDPGSVTLIGVTKGIPVERMREALSAGLADVGENRVQEAREKHAILHAEFPQVRWHLVGTLQRNKARDAVALFDTVHSVDALPLIDTLDAQCAARRPTPLEVMIQVNAAQEDTKHGCRPDEVAALADAIRRARHLRLTGLMTIAPLAAQAQASRPSRPALRSDPDGRSSASRPVFAQVRRLRDDLEPALKLSMGMSQDFEIAIEEGADYVRIGTAIFGERPQ